MTLPLTTPEIVTRLTDALRKVDSSLPPVKSFIVKDTPTIEATLANGDVWTVLPGLYNQLNITGPDLKQYQIIYSPSEIDGVSGQDRDSYSDTQDRDSYTLS